MKWEKRMGKLKKIFYSCLFGIGYWLLVQNYAAGNICMWKNSYFGVCILYFLCAALIIFKKEIENKTVVWKLETNKIIKGIILLLLPLVLFYCIELLYNDKIEKVKGDKVFLNYLLILIIEAGLCILISNYKTALVWTCICSWCFGLANHYIMEFKGNPLLPSELRAIKTALSVAGEYQFVLTDQVVAATLIMLVLICIIILLPMGCTEKDKRKKVVRLVKGSGYFLCVYWIAICWQWGGQLGLGIDSWNIYDSYCQNGSVLAFVLGGQIMQITVPDGYSSDEMENVLQKFEANEYSNKELRPSVIVIMNESFSDLSVLGEFESEEYLTNWYGIEQYLMRGNVYVSVYGGGTCNSEFEFLTGNSLSNLPQNVYPYTMYDLENVVNLAETFSENNYKTIAMHPMVKTNWNRSSVYQQFGFEQFISIEDMLDVDTLRGYTSDMSNYEQIIYEFEKSTDPIFVFNITMQNHGGYEDITALDSVEPISVDSAYQQYPDVITYLTLIRESDKAFNNLLNYFTMTDKPVIVCMFGDHQPALSDGFLDSLIDDDKDSTIVEQEKKYCVPYIIWANYDVGIGQVEKDMSLNYLGANLLRCAGISTNYWEYLLDLEGKLPVINLVGYKDSKDDWHNYQEGNDYITQYRKMGYYMMFGH